MTVKKFPLIVCFFLTAKLQAQMFTIYPDKVQVELNLYQYKPVGNDNAKERLNLTDVTQDKDTIYYFAKGFYTAG